MSVRITYAVSIVLLCLSGFITYQAYLLPGPAQGKIPHPVQKLNRLAGEKDSDALSGERGHEVAGKIKSFWVRISELKKAHGDMDSILGKRLRIQSENRAESLKKQPENSDVTDAGPEVAEKRPAEQKMISAETPPERQAEIGSDSTPLAKNQFTRSPSPIREDAPSTAKELSEDPPSADNSGIKIKAVIPSAPMERPGPDQTRPESESTIAEDDGLTAGNDSLEEKKPVMVITLGKGIFYSGYVHATLGLNQKIEEALHLIRAYPDTLISVEGHADNIPLRPSPNRPYSDNLGLSLWRATIVAAKLMEGGLPADRIKVMGYGDSRPIASNQTAEGRAQNRRVEVRVLPR